MWHDFLVAISLVLVIEGLLPFISPTYWQELVRTAADMNAGSIRIMGLLSMLVGTACLYLVN